MSHQTSADDRPSIPDDHENKTLPRVQPISRRTAARLMGAAAVVMGPGVRSVICQQADEIHVVPASGVYLLVDPKKCQGCQNCMAACSPVHHGCVNLSLARIQVAHDHLGAFPDDAIIAQCRQCVEPACVDACPTGALHADGSNGHVRAVDTDECIGCRECIDACPHTPARTVWNHETSRAQKCDLCASASFWKEAGGSGGKKACMEICPMRAITYTEAIPDQSGDAGYVANLRGETWRVFGFTVE